VGEWFIVILLPWQPLVIDNYRARFQALLYLEELQREVDIRQFDMSSVSPPRPNDTGMWVWSGHLIFMSLMYCCSILVTIGIVM